MSRRPLSLAARSTLATGFALAAFLGGTGFALDRAYYEGAISVLRDRLQGYVYAYLAGFEVSRYGKLIPPDPDKLPNPDFSRPGSGLYAAVVGEGLRWNSPSALGRELPFGARLAPGQTQFRGPLQTKVGRVYLLSEGVAWVVPNRGEINLTFHVAENEAQFERQLAAYRRTLFGWLAGLGVVLLLMQLLLLRWSLSPLRRVSGDLARIERGERERLSGRYPPELAGLTRSLNDFIESEREHLSRYRNTLADLAHSLKTPLAVVRSRLESENGTPVLRQDVLDQVRRMDEIVAYQLSRAATSGHQTFAAPVPLEPHAEEVVRGLEKVYAAKNILCEFDIEEGTRFYGEQGDLLELIGNLLENAFKWANHRVLLTARQQAGRGARRPGLELVVEDDGPGIPEERVALLLQRGVRGDERVQGHGIGLAIVQDIVRAYRAELDVDRSPELGGARFRVRLPEG
ncbi:MAG: ATP-binding protein [Mizugakiibacter sp.]|uniref:ATP-binding protein n=1 Tax=Mizugakiibacter sp. TaxID=1972610 RepID=UPI0031BDD9F5|nr:two-component sensor histidine kinase [Xanthomonadaceae bacterium]